MWVVIDVWFLKKFCPEML